MNTNPATVFIYILFITSTSRAEGRTVGIQQYIAAVVEHAPALVTSHDPAEVMKGNMKLYKNSASFAAQQGADIIVFPEYGLVFATVLSDLEKHPERVPSSMSYGPKHHGFIYEDYAHEVPTPDGQFNACEGSATSSDVLKELSCMARQNGLYVVANLIERAYDQGCISTCRHHLYNTNVAFDRNGNLVARYRKYNLYHEDLDRPSKPEHVTFCTDFDVCFGIFTCFDIAWYEPAWSMVENDGIRNFVFPTHFVDELPFLLATTVQEGFARSNDVNLLAAGHHMPTMGAMGSGIYAGDAGAKSYSYSVHDGGKVIIDILMKKSQWPIKKTDIKNNNGGLIGKKDFLGETPNSNSKSNHTIQHENLNKYNSTVLNESLNYAEVCHGKFCCSVEYDLDLDPKRAYRLFAFDGTKFVGLGVYHFYTEVCAVLQCSNDSIKECGLTPSSTSHSVFHKFKLKGSFSTPYVFPVSINEDLRLIPTEKLNFTHDAANEPDKTSFLNSLLGLYKIESPLALALFGRNFQKDSLKI